MRGSDDAVCSALQGVIPKSASMPLLRWLSVPLLFLTLWSGALDTRASAQTIPLQNYSEGGLPKLATDCLVEDAQHYIWACTYVGLFRYDGEQFQQIGVEAGFLDTYIVQVAPSADGHGLWVASTANLYFWDGKRAQRIMGPDGKPIAFSVGHVITAIPGGAVVISDGKALEVRQGKQGWLVAPLSMAGSAAVPTNLGAVYLDGHQLWFGCGSGICLRDVNGSARVFGEGDGVPHDRWTAFLRDREGRLWARSPRHILLLDNKAVRFEDQSVLSGMSGMRDTRHLDLVEDHHGQLLTRGERGLLRRDGTRWSELDEKNGLPGRSPGSLLVSERGDLWMSFAGIGVVRVPGYGDIESWSVRDGLTGTPTWAIARTRQGGVLLGDDGGLFRLDEADGRALPNDVGALPVRDVYSMVKDRDGALWVSIYGGALLKLDQAGKAREIASGPHNFLRVLIDQRGSLWLCTARGMWTIEDPRQPVLQAVKELPNAYFGDVTEDGQGRLWFASKQGVFRREVNGRYTPIRTVGQISNALFDKIAVGPDGEIWVATDTAGLLHGKAGDDGRVVLEPVDDPLLRDSLPLFIRYDSHHRLWVGGSSGVDIRDNGHWRRLDESAGLLNNDISEGAFFEDEDGSIWIGSALGATHILHPADVSDVSPPRLVVDQVERGGRVVLPDTVLPWAQLPVRMKVSTPGTVSDPGMLRIRYRLRGHQDKWIETTSRTIDFASLGSGRQVVDIQALDLVARSASPILSFRFYVRPPWWRSQAALFIWATALFLAAFVGWQSRLRRVRMRERELEKLVAQRTAELEAEKQALERARAALQVQANYDALTGLRNRGCIMDILAIACRNDTGVAVAISDLDHFKRINDTYGHLAGDAVLRAVADRFATGMTGSDLTGRYGGEELLVVMPSLASATAARLEKLRAAVGSEPVSVDGVEIAVTCSFGVARQRPGETPEQVLGRADQALYQAKRAGRNRIVEDLDVAHLLEA